MATLSKSKLLSSRQCAKRLWLEVHHPTVKADSAATEQGYKTGNQWAAPFIFGPINILSKLTRK